MKRKYLVLSLALSLLGSVAVAQQKLSDFTDSEGMVINPDAILDLASKNKGLLHTRVPLSMTTLASPLSKHVAGMMVYNTATANDVVPGIYYNDGAKWVLVSAGKATNISYNPTDYIISFVDSGGNTVNIDFKEVVKRNETITTLVNNGDGTITYTNEKGIPVTVNLANGPKGDKGDAGVVGVQGMPGTSGTPGIPGSGTAGAPGEGVTIVTNDSGTWVYNPTTDTWTNINGPQGIQGPKVFRGAFERRSLFFYF